MKKRWKQWLIWERSCPLLWTQSVKKIDEGLEEQKREMKMLELEGEVVLFFRFLQRKKRDDLWFQHDERRLSLGSDQLIRFGQVFLEEEEKVLHWSLQERSIWEKDLVLQMEKRLDLMKGL